MSNAAMITIISNAVRKAARGVVRDFGEIDKLQISKKGAANYVTNADIRTEKLLVEELQKARPKFGFLTEESGIIGNPNMKERFVIDPIDGTTIIGNPNMKERFVIDPIDGTTNFIHAIPYISISVGAQQRNAEGEWETTAGVVYDPIHDELFSAIRGGGAFLNGMRLRISPRKEDLLLSTTSPRKGREGFEETLAAFQRVTMSGATVRCSGSAALDLAYVAAGRLDGIWYQRLNAWDMVAGSLIAQEAGGMVTSIDGSPVATDGKGSLLASNGPIHKGLHALLVG